jgi:hypothetical protein
MPPRAIRVPGPEWQQFKDAAETRGESASLVARRLFREFVAKIARGKADGGAIPHPYTTPRSDGTCSDPPCSICGRDRDDEIHPDQGKSSGAA